MVTRNARSVNDGPSSAPTEHRVRVYPRRRHQPGVRLVTALHPVPGGLLIQPSRALAAQQPRDPGPVRYLEVHSEVEQRLATHPRLVRDEQIVALGHD